MKLFIALPKVVGTLSLALTLGCSGVVDAKDDGKDAAKSYEIATVFEPAAPKAGAEAFVHFTISPKGDYVLKNETPFKLLLSSPSGVELPKTKFTAEDFVDPKATAKGVKIPFKAGKGKHAIAGDLTFFLCTVELCERFTDKVTIAVAVD